MSDHDVQQEEAAPDAPAETTSPDAPEETTAEGATGADAEVADTVDELAIGHLTDSTPSPQPEGVEGDPIGDAEAHLASLDMEEERRKAAELMKKL